MDKPAILQNHILAVLQLLRAIENRAVHMEGGGAYDCGTWFWADDYKPGNSVMNAFPKGTSTLRARAIMKKMDKIGLVKGCHCGCRGCYQLTPDGRKVSFEKQIYRCFH